MLTSIELQLQQPVILCLLRLFRLEQVFDIVLCQEGTAQYSHDFIYASVEQELPYDRRTLQKCGNPAVGLPWKARFGLLESSQSQDERTSSHVPK